VGRGGGPDPSECDDDEKEYDETPHVLDPVGEVVDGVEVPVDGHGHKVGDEGGADLHPRVLPDGMDVRLHSSHSCSEKDFLRILVLDPPPPRARMVTKC